MHLSLIIPAYNEAERLPKTLETIQQWVEAQDFPVQVLIVDDGSKDATSEVVKKYQEDMVFLELLSLNPNRGKGGAVAAGMLAASGTHRLMLDADGATPITEAQKLLEQRDQADIVIGSRYLESGSIKVKQPLGRRIVSRVGNTLIQLSVLPGLKDTQCGFKLFTKEAAEAVFSRTTVKGWLFDVEVLAIAQELGYSVLEVPVDWYDDEKSKLRAVRSSLKAMGELWDIRRKRARNHYTDEAKS
jgi:glycosyltransferase involved in cell wall biosynthesis